MLIPLLLAISGVPEAGAGRDLFGAAVALVDDLDGGGHPDLAISEPAWTDSLRDRGRVWLVSVETGKGIRCIEPGRALPEFGWTLASVGDVDGDGHGDLAIGQLNWRREKPDALASLMVVSCTDGRVLHDWSADTRSFWYAWYCFAAGPVACGVGDWDGDGRADVAVGGRRDADCRGRVDVYSGRDGSTLRTFFGEDSNAGLGVSLCTVDDLDGDSKRELVAGMVPGADNACSRAETHAAASVRVYSSKDASILAELRPETPSPVFGLSIASSGDLDGDGRADLWIGEPLANFMACPLVTPGLQAWSSRDWKPLRRVAGSTKNDGYTDRRFATVLVPIDDLDGDGRRDVVATIPDSFGSEASVISAQGAVLGRFEAKPTNIPANALGPVSLGMSACAVGDVDKDGSRDVAMSGTTWRGFVTGAVVIVSPMKRTTLRTFTRASIEPDVETDAK